MTEPTPKEEFAFPTADKHEPKSDEVEIIETHPSEDAIDQGVAESFPASDPVSVSVTKVERKEGDE